MPNFAQRVEVAVDALSSNPPKDVDENEFIDASRLVYDGVREIRRAVLMNRVSFFSTTTVIFSLKKKSKSRVLSFRIVLVTYLRIYFVL